MAPLIQRRVFAFMLLLCSFCGGRQVLAQNPIFLGEDLVFYISDSLCVLRGEYHFLNPSQNPVKTRLFYPFPVSEELPFPDEIEVLSMETGNHLPLLGSETGISFLLTMEPLAQANIQIEYWQPAESQRFEYILTSTQKWGRALKWANYEIHIPEHLELEECSLGWDTSWVEIEETIYSISRENYIPTQDFELRWGLKK
ncbi:MAG: hypothetical protein K9M55_03660 [Candidatus Marinimicrobia bacterium]|nr:hypothetical protein [Candidatus Neomarinimicrobiota bacterium]MCF7921776.1 hypothetical protein [Candidatus Neomarinimicrobiota bacterium]